MATDGLRFGFRDRTRNWLITRIIIEKGSPMLETPHPGEFIREEVLTPLELGVTEAARLLSVSRTALSRVLNGRAGISADLAIRLELAGVSTAQFWTALQTRYDLEQARKRKHDGVTRFPKAA
jgi:antitoxin HigA-1